MDTYLWLKALHVASALVFVGGLLAQSVVLHALAEDAPPHLVQAVRRWDRLATGPALLLVWGFGLAAASSGGWFTAPWLMAKLVVVIGLSALHGLQAGRLRRLERESGTPGFQALPRIGLGILLGAAIIAVLAVLKPGATI
ncbi:CopD family protein [Arenibaculum pallidiluteum]|uniref:CopD family protein n=1 Tax=Arenibaculum pallidiluteum TaxID=2812559 RepID=UPI001A960D30|nr:CopD family protein [Arenibaculum pallidiluteum]